MPLQAADGDGPSLVLSSPRSNPDHNDAANWRAGDTVNGTPGQPATSTTFAGDPNAEQALLSVRGTVF